MVTLTCRFAQNRKYYVIFIFYRPILEGIERRSPVLVFLAHAVIPAIGWVACGHGVAHA